MGGLPSNATSLSFVIQEHHARALHWDFRLEHEGVLVSWALPKGVPTDPKTNHLAVRTEDHPMDYGSFEGDIPAGQYGAGTVKIWDQGHFELEKWFPNEVMVVLHGDRVEGRYVLFPAGGKNWMIHRMDPMAPGHDAMPKTVQPMLATSGALPTDQERWAYEIKWDGVRAIAFVDGGRVRLQSRNGNDLSPMFPEILSMGEAMVPGQSILDGEIVVIGHHGRPDFGRLQQRLHLTQAAAIKHLAHESPASYVLFDLLYLDGRALIDRTYDERRALLEGLHLGGTAYTTGVSYTDVDGEDVLESTRQNGLEGVVAKRRASRYVLGRRSDDWIKIKNVRTQEVVIGGWTEGTGSRKGSIGALLLGVPDTDGLRYVGKVGSGFSAHDREMLLKLLRRHPVKRNPFTASSRVKEPAVEHFVSPRQVGEVQFSEWTKDSRLRHPSWRGLRGDKSPKDVAFE